MAFTVIGAMLDCSRNAIMTVPELKKFMTLLSKMGYNQLQLYMEDTYEVPEEPFFGHFRGRFSQAELKELDDFAFSLGMELVPCMQTLAHFNQLVKWPMYQEMMDDADVLMVGEERTYEFIENIIASLRQCFRTNRIHIGMDEAHRLGKGRYRDKHGERNRADILLEHLNRVCEITRKYNFKPQMWSDMFYRIANGGHYYGGNVKFDPSIKAAIPEDVTIVYWDYYHSDKKTYTQMLGGHKQLSDRLVFAGGAWKWSGFAPHNAYSLRCTKAALAACREQGVGELLMTMWGDNGAEASAWSVLPTLCYAACVAQGITDMATIKAKFEECVGCRYDDFLLLDLPDKLTNTKHIVNPSKYLLYNDPLMGILDSARCGNEAEKYASFARRLSLAAKRTGEWGYLFDTLSKLCSVLTLKADLGVRTRKAYGDREAIAALIPVYKKTTKRIEVFYEAFRTQWYKENKPHAFDVHELRIGGLLMRMKSATERLEKYARGELERIPELEERALPFPYGTYNTDDDTFAKVYTAADEETVFAGMGITCYNQWLTNATANLHV